MPKRKADSGNASDASNHINDSSTRRRASRIVGKGKATRGSTGLTTPQRPGAAKSHNSLSTPSKQRAGHSESLANAATPMATIGNERHREMLAEYHARHIADDDSVLKLAEPLSTTQRQAARRITREAVRFMEAELKRSRGKASAVATTKQEPGQRGSARLRSPTTSFHVEGIPENMKRLSGLTLNTSSADDDTKKLANIDELRDWVAKGPLRLERGMYNPIMAFVSYVALSVQAGLHSSHNSGFGNGRGTGLSRLICPVGKADYKPSDSDDGTRIDIGLCTAGLDGPGTIKGGRAPYSRLFAIVEAKTSAGDVDDATVQLFEYTRQLYQTQHDLRFAWGLTVCGHDVRVCHFGNDRAMSSRKMDVATRKGRHAFIELLVNWSLCEASQLGRDPTMEHLPELQCWRIDCLDDDDDALSKPQRYYFSEVVCHADRLFGRHTRCFRATDVEPTREDYRIEPTRVIKDSWPFAEKDPHKDPRDEVKLLRKIKKSLAARKDDDDDIIFPEIVVGGRVWFSRDGKYVEDNTDTVYLGVAMSAKQENVVRDHLRIVMLPFGERLHTINSAEELVTVLCDIMRCHDAVFKHCNILHRDISDNNVLVVRRDGIARGLLIDFDCAIDLSKKRSGSTRPEMTGTLPFMSINNLRSLDVGRTTVDDWESLLYLVCWIATIGCTGSPGETSEVLKDLPIAMWRKNDVKTAVNAKLAHLSSENKFRENILDNFSDNRDDRLLCRFATELYRALFQNSAIDADCCGTSDIQKNTTQQGILILDDDGNEIAPPVPQAASGQLSGANEPEFVDPFKERAKKHEAISSALLVVVDKYRLFTKKKQAAVKLASAKPALEEPESAEPASAELADDRPAKRRKATKARRKK